MEEEIFIRYSFERIFKPMKETIYTIPVNEAFDEEGSCPFCTLFHKLEQERVTYTLGASMMEPDARAVTNELGFCQRHFKMLFDMPNKLSLALVLDTHLRSVISKLETAGAGVGEEEKSGGLFKKKSTDSSALLAHFASSVTNECAICKNINSTMERYFDVFFYMWENDSDFKKKFDDCAGICLVHFGELASKSQKYLKANTAKLFLSDLLKKQQTLFASLSEDIHKFTLKFDYRNKDMPWGSAKDAPKRVIEYLSGESLGGKDDKNA